MDKTQGVTMLGDLPELDEIDGNMYQPEQSRQRQQYHDNMTPNVAKFLRHRANPPPQSGMHRKEYSPYSPYNSYGQHPQQQDRYNDMAYNSHQNNPPDHYNPPMPQQPIENYDEYIENYEDQVPGNCRDVCKHIKNCEICGKLYKNDRTIFLVIIVILSILCILLLKKVLKI